MILSLYVKVFLGASMESQKLSIFINLVILFFKSYDAVHLCEGILWRQPRKSEAGHPSSNDLGGGAQVSQDYFLLRTCWVKGSDQRENRGVGSYINTRYLVWRCGDGRSFAL